MSAGDVRVARWRLAQLLSPDDEGRAEARVQLHRALATAGDDPPDWQIHGGLARLEQSAGDSTASLRHYFQAIVTAPDDWVADLAEAAYLLLTDLNQGTVDGLLADLDVQALSRRAYTDDAPGALARLTTEILVRRGDVDGALRLLKAKPTERLPAGDSRRAQERLAYVASLVDDDHWEEALQVLGQDDVTGGTAEVNLRSLSLYACGRFDDAWAILERPQRQRTFEQALLRSLILLQRAAAAGLTELRHALARDALTAAAEATQMEPTRPDTSLLRAEAMLEGGLDLDEGRKLLRRALRRLDADLDTLGWWRAQTRARDDEVHCYFRIEIAAAQDRHEEVLRRVREATTATTEYVQDGAMAELEARALTKLGDTAAATAAYLRAADAFTAADDRARGTGAFEKAVDLVGPGVISLDLVERLVEGPVADGADGTDGQSAVDRARLHLNAADGWVAGPEAVRACFLAGIVLSRATTDRAAAWLALPHLLVACLAEEGYDFRSANLAWTLLRVELDCAGRYFGEAALDATDDPSPWIVETAVVTRFNWIGRIDDADDRRLSTDGLNDSWVASLRGAGHLLVDDRVRLCETVERMDFDDFWARLGRGHAMARCGGGPAAVTQFVEVLKDARETGAAGAAVEAAVMLGNFDTAREQVTAGEEAGTLDRYWCALWRALIDVCTGTAEAAARLRLLIRQGVRPMDIRVLGQVYLPTLVEITPVAPEVVSMLHGLRADCLVALERMPSDAPVTVELDSERVTCADTRLRAAVRTLLEAVELRRRGRVEAAGDALRALTYRPEVAPESFIRSLEAAADRLAGLSGAT